MTKPYTYLIGWSRCNIWYYGARWASGCSPTDLWGSYFTSSKEVAKTRALWGDPDVVQIRKVFDGGIEARAWEERVIRRVGAVRSPHWLNRGNGGRHFAGPSEEEKIRISERLRGVPKTEESKAKLRAAWKRRKENWVHRPHSAESKAKMRAAKIGIPRSDETKAKLRAVNLGKTISSEAKAKISATNTGSKRSEETRAKMRAAWERRKCATSTDLTR